MLSSGFVPSNWEISSPLSTGFGAFLSIILWIVSVRDELGSWWPSGCTLTQLLVSNITSGGREVTQLCKPTPWCQVWPPQWVGPQGTQEMLGSSTFLLVQVRCHSKEAPGTGVAPEQFPQPQHMAQEHHPHTPAPTKPICSPLFSRFPH